MGADAVLFEGAVMCELQARMRLGPGPVPVGAAETAERLLRDLAIIEERRGEGDETVQPADPAWRRLEAKLDLTLQLLAQALPELRGPEPQRVALSARGVRFEQPQAMGDAAVLLWQPGDGLPLVLALPVRPIGPTDDPRWWAFDGLEPSLVDLLERHVFRLHRRWLATHRRS